MEATYGSVTVTLTNGLLMCAGEVLTTLLVSALFKTQLLKALVSCGVIHFVIARKGFLTFLPSLLSFMLTGAFAI